MYFGRYSQWGQTEESGRKWLTDWETGDTLEIDPSGEVWSVEKGHVGFVQNKDSNWIIFDEGNDNFYW